MEPFVPHGVKVSAIVPAHDEGPTIAGVVAPLISHPLVDEVIVVDDASTDDTAARAAALGATVVAMPENGGKAAAMARGVAHARNRIVFFSDADVVGLDEDMITRIVAPVTSGAYDM